MARYIDAEELKSAIRKAFPSLMMRFDINSIINEQPTADVPQWIPCNERLPKEDGDYLVTLDFAWGKEIEMGEWFEGEWINDNSHVTVAWMPLPNPWKGEADGRIH